MIGLNLSYHFFFFIYNDRPEFILIHSRAFYDTFFRRGLEEQKFVPFCSHDDLFVSALYKEDRVIIIITCLRDYRNLLIQ